MKRIQRIPELVQRLYALVDELEKLFPHRRFTLDGVLVGSIGEVLAESHYNLKLYPSSTEGHDAVSSSGRQVQIKATQAKSVGLRSEPEHLLVLRLTRDGRAEEVFNGPGGLAWQNAGKMQKNGQKAISVSKLERLMESVPDGERLLRTAD